MKTKEKTLIRIEAYIIAPIEKVWKAWTSAEDIEKWNHASDDWHTPKAELDFRVGGKFLYRMEAKDGSSGFDFSGIYTHIIYHKRIEYILSDGRKVRVTFISVGNQTIVKESFISENQNPVELQRKGWQSILNSFKKHVESL